MPKGEIKKGNVIFSFHMTPKHSKGKLDIYSRNFTKYRTFTKSLSTGLFSLQNVNDTPRKTKFMAEGMGGKTSLGFKRHQSKINIMGNTKESHEAFFTFSSWSTYRSRIQKYFIVKLFNHTYMGMSIYHYIKFFIWISCNIIFMSM